MVKYIHLELTGTAPSRTSATQFVSCRFADDSIEPTVDDVAKVASLDSPTPAIWIVRQCPETPKGQFSAEICYLTQGQIIAW